jgi:putative oxidoreductase
MSGLLDVLIPYTGYLALALRVWIGASFIIHSRPKLGKGMVQTAQFMKGMGIPVGAAYTATALELFGGIFLIVGLIVPIVALFFAIFMTSNIIMKRTKMHANYIDAAKPSYEIDALYLGLSLVLLVLGSGVLSLDGLIGL